MTLKNRSRSGDWRRLFRMPGTTWSKCCACRTKWFSGELAGLIASLLDQCFSIRPACWLSALEPGDVLNRIFWSFDFLAWMWLYAMCWTVGFPQRSLGCMLSQLWSARFYFCDALNRLLSSYRFSGLNVAIYIYVCWTAWFPYLNVAMVFLSAPSAACWASFDPHTFIRCCFEPLAFTLSISWLECGCMICVESFGLHTWTWLPVLNWLLFSVPPQLHVGPALICALLFGDALNCCLRSFWFPCLNVAICFDVLYYLVCLFNVAFMLSCFIFTVSHVYYMLIVWSAHLWLCVVPSPSTTENTI